MGVALVAPRTTPAVVAGGAAGGFSGRRRRTMPVSLLPHDADEHWPEVIEYEHHEDDTGDFDDDDFFDDEDFVENDPLRENLDAMFGAEVKRPVTVSPLIPILVMGGLLYIVARSRRP